MKQWERERILQIEAAAAAADKTKQEDALQIIRFGREDGVTDEKIRQRLADYLNLKPDIIDTLFAQVDSEELVH